MNDKNLELIHTPLRNGRIRLNTRIVFPPMATHTAENGLPGEKTIQHYQRIARNTNLGLLIVEHCYIAPDGIAGPNQLSFASNRVITAHQKLLHAIRSANPFIRVAVQLNHAGAYTLKEYTGNPLVSSSDVRLRDETASSLTREHIHTLEQKFADAALRAKDAGYDAVEIHSAHSYLLNQFYTPLINARTDEYGPQNLENRLRFLTETISAVRNAVDDFPIFVRLGGCDYQEGGSTIQDAAEAGKILENAGIDLLDLSGGVCFYARKGHREPGFFSDMSSLTKKNVSIPVILTGGVRTPEQAEELLKENKADLIGIGRSMFKNPNWGE